MENKYLLAYLRDFYNDPHMNRILDYFKVDFDYYLYAYGCQFGVYDNRESQLLFLYEKGAKWRVTLSKFGIRSLISFIHRKAQKLVNNYRLNKISNKFNSKGSYKTVLFIESVSLKTREMFADKNIKIVCIEEYNNNRHPDIHNIFNWYKKLSKLSFKERLDLRRYDCLDDFVKIIINNFNGFNGLFVGNDEYFICKLFIDAFKEMNIPTYNWSHGLDCAIGIKQRTDYTLVWGKALRDNLINDGKNKDSVLVSGNIHYFDVANMPFLRNSLDDVLVLTSVTVANIRHSWDYELFDKWDRSLLITYIYSVENVLKSLGVSHARLRPHPINNKLWIDKFIDTDFYTMDYLPLDKSLEKATLAIGPTSSTFVEALRKGVTYLVYEPGGDNGKNLIETPLIPPFDGSDGNIRVAFNEDQLKDLIRKKYSYDSNILNNYMVPFNIESFINTLG